MILWLFGPPGAGKTTVAREIVRTRPEFAHLDTDQIGLCYPAPDDDQENHRVKSASLAALWPLYRDAGARGLVVSGNLRTAEDYGRYRLDGATITLCRLRAEPEVHKERFLRRGRFTDLVGLCLEEAAALERTEFADFTVDTTHLSTADSATLVLERTGFAR
ncbi:AAA family ATPase [Amycolatopsis lurida]